MFGYLSGFRGFSSLERTLVVQGDFVRGGRILDKGGMIINVRAYSADGNPLSIGIGGNTDADSIAIEAAFADLRAQQAAMGAIAGDGRFTRIHFPAGTYKQVRPVLATGLVGCHITGDGVQSTRFALATGSGSNDATYWSTKPMWDVSGNNFLRMSNISIQPDNTGASDLIPQVGLLVGQDTGNTCNANYFDTLRVAGAFIKAAHINYASPSSLYVRCSFFRNKSTNGAFPNGTNVGEGVLVLTQGNQIGAQAAPGGVTLADPLVVGVSCSDLTFVDCEINDLCNGGVGSCVCPALWLDEAYDIRFYGGNISGHGSSYIRMSGGKTGMTGTGCRNILFDSLFMYTEGGGDTVPIAIRLTGNNTDDWAGLRNRVERWTAADSGTHTSDIYEIMASDVTIRNCQVSVASGGGLIGGGRIDGVTPANASETPTFIRWHVENVQIKDATALVNQANIFLFGGTPPNSDFGTFRDCYLECHGNSLAGNGSTIVRGTLVRPGTITGVTMTDGAYEISGGGAVSLTDNDTGFYGQGSASLTETAVVPVRITQACKVFNLRVATATAPGGALSLTFFLRKATPSTTMTFANTTLTGTIATTSLTGADTTRFVDCAAGDVLLVSVANPNTGATTAWVSWSLSAIPI